MGQDQHADIAWDASGVPVSARFDDPYYSLENGLEETRHTFLAGNDLPARFAPGFQIAELGFGTGLNLLATLLAWKEAGAPEGVTFTSFEAFPMPVDEMARALSSFPQVAALSAPLVRAWGDGLRAFELEGMQVRIIEGDARETLPDWRGAADAWFLDGFSPAKNPELWGAALMEEVARHTRPGGTLATYTAAGFVRRNLEAAGFEVTRRAGYGRKRHMTTARLDAAR